MRAPLSIALAARRKHRLAPWLGWHAVTPPRRVGMNALLLLTFTRNRSSSLSASNGRRARGEGAKVYRWAGLAETSLVAYLRERNRPSVATRLTIRVCPRITSLFYGL